MLVAWNKNMVPQKALHNTLTQKEKKQGWQLLFDGNSYSGWTKYGGATTGKAWKIKDSSIYLDAGAKKADWQTNDGGDIVTTASFSDFHLQYDWKIAQGGNSGVIFYVHEDTTKYQWPWQTGPEMQVLDNERHADAKINKHRAGDLYDLIASNSEPVKPALEWNHAEIKSVKGNLDFYLNGVHILSTQLWNDNWKKLIAASKFSSMQGFGIYQSGKISLQDHGDEVWFR
ncbi:MAG: DUF1080 domain-containing protein, partial [Sphingobacteriales bacterium]